MAEVAPGFSTLLKQWRQHRRISQLDLAADVGVSQRHLSFLETGRANPSQPMVLALAEALHVPLRERNSLLQSAGYVASFVEGNLDEASHSAFRSAIDQILAQQEPFQPREDPYRSLLHRGDIHLGVLLVVFCSCRKYSNYAIAANTSNCGVPAAALAIIKSIDPPNVYEAPMATEVLASFASKSVL